jgi:hypothetical protein
MNKSLPILGLSLQVAPQFSPRVRLTPTSGFRHGADDLHCPPLSHLSSLPPSQPQRVVTDPSERRPPETARASMGKTNPGLRAWLTPLVPWLWASCLAPEHTSLPVHYVRGGGGHLHHRCLVLQRTAVSGCDPLSLCCELVYTHPAYTASGAHDFGQPSPSLYLSFLLCKMGLSEAKATNGALGLAVLHTLS